MPPHRPTATTALTLLLALAGPPLFVLVPDRLFGPFPSLGVQIVLQALYCGLPALVAWIVVHREHLPLRSIGLRRPDWSTLVSGVLLWGVVTYALPLVTGPLLAALGTDGVQTGLARLAPLPVWFRLVLGVTGGIVEETLYRGYAVERLAAITGRPWLAGTVAAVAFGIAHAPAWGLGFALGADLPFGLVMTLFYLWKRDLLANVLAHSAGLAVALVALAP